MEEKKRTILLVDDSEWLFDGIPAEPIGARGENGTINGPIRWAIDAEGAVWVTCDQEMVLEKPDRAFAKVRLYWYAKDGYEEMTKLK